MNYITYLEIYVSKCIAITHVVCSYTYFPVAPSVTDATVTLVTPDLMMFLHSITITCTIHPESHADMCEVRTTANGQTLIGNECEHTIIDRL